jgi:integrase
MAWERKALEMERNLTVTQIRALPAKRDLIGFGNHLYLDVAASGSKSWTVIYRDPNKRIETASGKQVGMKRWFGLGSFDQGMMPKEARDLADATMVKVRRGIDVVAERAQNRIDALVSTKLFSDVAKLEIAARNTTRWKQNADKGNRHGTAQKWEAQFMLHLPTIWSMPIRNITDDVAVAAMKVVFAKSIAIYDAQVSNAAAVMDRAIADRHHPGPNPFRFKGHLDKRVGDRVVSKAVKAGKADTKVPSMRFEDAPAFVAKLIGLTGMIPRCLAFLSLTGVRTDEARCARMSEIDWDNKVWLIPASRMKASEDHAVPLADEAMAILLAIRAERGEQLGEFIFSSNGGATPIEYKAMYKKMCGPATKMQNGKKVWTGNMGLQGIACPHGMRSTFTTWAEEQVLPGTDTPRWSEKAITQSIAHAHGNASDRSYLRSPLMKQRRVMAQEYASFLCTPPQVTDSGSNVSAFKKAA